MKVAGILKSRIVGFQERSSGEVKTFFGKASYSTSVSIERLIGITAGTYLKWKAGKLDHPGRQSGRQW